jgi:hypothetical protein
MLQEFKKSMTTSLVTPKQNKKEKYFKGQIYLNLP